MAIVLDEAPAAELPDRYEEVNGVILEREPMSGFASEVANRIQNRLVVHAETTRTGRVRMDMLFRLPLPEDPARKREPDAAFISFDRWPADRPMPYRGNPVDVVPDLMLEVASPTDRAEPLMEKADDYLRAGVRLVWVVFPRLKRLYAYTQPGAAPRVFGEADTLDGGDVLPGFTVPMAGLFPPLVPGPEPEPPADD